MTEKKDATKAGKEAESATSTELKKAEQPSYSERFSTMVTREFSGTAGELSLTAYQRRLIQNYFLATDMALKAAEDKRLKRDEKSRDALSVTWENVNMPLLALNVVACARIGFDPALPNHINMVPYKNNRTNKYDIGFIEGYRGKELKAKKYGFEVPDNVIVKLVYRNEKFMPIYRDKNNKTEDYVHQPAPDPFDRGEVVGGYYYHAYTDEPEKNKLMYYTVAEIEKRKPEYASVEFWGGEKTKWEKDPATGKSKKAGTEKVEGWYEEMCWKTVHRMAYSAITIDSEKIDENLMRIMENQMTFESNKDSQHLEALRENTQRQIEQSGNQTVLNADDISFVDITPTGSRKEPQPENTESLSDLGAKAPEPVKQELPY